MPLVHATLFLAFRPVENIIVQPRHPAAIWHYFTGPGRRTLALNIFGRLVLDVLACTYLIVSEFHCFGLSKGSSSPNLPAAHILSIFLQYTTASLGPTIPSNK